MVGTIKKRLSVDLGKGKKLEASNLDDQGKVYVEVFQ